MPDKHFQKCQNCSNTALVGMLCQEVCKIIRTLYIQCLCHVTSVKHEYPGVRSSKMYDVGVTTSCGEYFTENHR